jgi:hypothetical protein
MFKTLPCLANDDFLRVSADTILAPRGLALYYESTGLVLYQISNKSQQENGQKMRFYRVVDLGRRGN